MATKRRTVIAGAVVAGVLVIGGGIAVAANSGDDDRPLTGSTLDRASAAAVAAVGGGTVVESEVGDGGAAYEVEVRTDDGGIVEVALDADFRVIGTAHEGSDDGSGEAEDGPGEDD